MRSSGHRRPDGEAPDPPRFDWVTFTSDYGHDDVFVGVCKGSIAQVAPHVKVIDVCHLVAAQDVEHGAVTLASAVPFLPVGIHLALVDPMHGSSSRGIVARAADGSIFVGPDNGVLSLAWPACGDVTEAFEITNSNLFRPVVHKTFRGRDVFSPVVGHLANGLELSEVGPQVDVDSLVRIRQRDPEVDHDHVHAEVRTIDHFGNVALNVARSDLEAAGIGFGDMVELRCNGRSLTVPFVPTYGDVAGGRLTLCEDSFHAVQLAVNAGHASRELRVTRGEPVVIARLRQR